MCILCTALTGFELVLAETCYTMQLAKDIKEGSVKLSFLIHNCSLTSSLDGELIASLSELCALCKASVAPAQCVL